MSEVDILTDSHLAVGILTVGHLAVGILTVGHLAVGILPQHPKIGVRSPSQ
jgi:hypothetical protein